MRVPDAIRDSAIAGVFGYEILKVLQWFGYKEVLVRFGHDLTSWKRWRLADKVIAKRRSKGGVLTVFWLKPSE